MSKVNFISSRVESISSTDRMNEKRKALESNLNIKLDNLENPSFDVDEVSSKNCENLIGKIEIPVGVAGPMKVNGKYANGNYFVPLATTEGALVASVNRGCKAVTASGGIFVNIIKSEMTRAPVFVVKNCDEAKTFVEFVQKNIVIIKKLVIETSPFIKLIAIDSYISGRNVFLRFKFDTKDAMGMNMATFACDHVIRSFIYPKTKVKCLSLSGNVCTDKKAAWINKINGRGHTTHAEVVISNSIVKTILKSTPSKIYEVYLRKLLIGSQIAGSMGVNAHHANIVAAIFAATGQDLAHVVEGALGTTTVEIDKKGLFVSVDLPSLVLGTVGGGTNLASQKQALSIMGVGGSGKIAGNNAKKFAEIATSAVLCGELSLLAALSSNDLAKAHMKFGRGEKVK